jgi:hypothetical protein
MLLKYDSLIAVKTEVDAFSTLLNNAKNLPDENNIKCITKYIIFLKGISEYGENRHYKNSMICDLLMLMHSLTENSIRNFYQTYRSFVENFIRSVLNLADNDSTGVRNLFNSLNEKFNSSAEMNDIINYINGEYSKACNYVHSNITAKSNVYTFYSDILKADEMNIDRLKSLIQQILTLMKKLSLFIIYKFPVIISTIFYKRNQELKFLIGSQNYGLFQTSLEHFNS